MCGICGEMRFDGTGPDPFDIHLMMTSMAPRGPEEEGLIMHGNVTLGHRRLKIIDLSEQARQPMSDSHLGIDIVFNGAIYNYRELRRELEREGYRFFSSGDTEVLIKAYHAWGKAFVTRLNGMFALAIRDRERRRLILLRDRCGIKPLYYADMPGGVRFASSMTALLDGGGINSEIDPVSLHHFMTFHAVVPAPRTILKGVRKVPPATMIVIDEDGRRSEGRYWEPSYEPDHSLTFLERKEEIRRLLSLSVERRLVADVPVGVLLSGGIDSSLVVALLAKMGKGLKTFSIGFEDAGGEEGNEFFYSDLVAERFGTDHTKVEVDSGKLLGSLERCVRAMAEPMVSHDNIGFYLLSEEISKQIKVVESGQGADEIFGGYMWYPSLLVSGNSVEDYARVFFDMDHEEYGCAVQPHLVGEDYSRLFVEEHFARDGAPRTLDKALRLDTEVMLVEDPVKRVDNMTMAFGLEARVPFLDHEVVEFAARTPAEWKVQGDVGKYILKEASRGLVPTEVIDRPKKPFPVPALKYIEGPYLELARNLLESTACRERGIFQKSYIAGLLRDPGAHLTPLKMSKLWQAAMLEYWLQCHVDQFSMAMAPVA